jgi:hypothetical protein
MHGDFFHGQTIQGKQPPKIQNSLLKKVADFEIKHNFSFSIGFNWDNFFAIFPIFEKLSPSSTLAMKPYLFIFYIFHEQLS